MIVASTSLVQMCYSAGEERGSKGEGARERERVIGENEALRYTATTDTLQWALYHN